MRGFRNRKVSALLSLFLFSLFVVQGCIQTSRINTKPEGAQVLLNGAPLGETPVYYQSRSGIPKTYFVEIQKPGYNKVQTKLESTYRADVSLLLLLAGIFPYFFSARLEDDYHFSLIRNQGQR